MTESLIERIKKGKAVFEDAIGDYFLSEDRTIGLRSTIAIENMSDFGEIIGYTLGVVSHPIKSYRALRGL